MLLIKLDIKRGDITTYTDEIITTYTDEIKRLIGEYLKMNPIKFEAV